MFRWIVAIVRAVRYNLIVLKKELRKVKKMDEVEMKAKTPNIEKLYKIRDGFQDIVRELCTEKGRLIEEQNKISREVDLLEESTLQKKRNPVQDVKYFELQSKFKTYSKKINSVKKRLKDIRDKEKAVDVEVDRFARKKDKKQDIVV